ncbi:MAG: hypothetical protein H6842_05435 [Rhodospirillaceae bacterium]|nr:hypothetical protein [Rhodospirillaceae bacterium]
MPKEKTRPMTAWLILWEGDCPDGSKPCLDVVSARKGYKYVMNYVKQLHDIHLLRISERLPAARYYKPSATQYQARMEHTENGAIIYCGDAPTLMAKRVHNLVIETDSDTWEESVIYQWGKRTVQIDC